MAANLVPCASLGLDLTDTGPSVGGIRLDGRAALAPMSGVTDAVMRRIARRLGASFVVSEMVASDRLAIGDQEAVLRAQACGLPPHIVQLAGREPSWMGEAARAAEATGAAIIDINMGCPAKRVTGGWSGSALMRDLDHALTLIEATVKAVAVPVTVKMRLGWDDTSLNAPELARLAEAAGVAMITVHGRTRQQFYKGRADWAAIRRVREAISIPLVANGDCASVADARAMIAASGADAVMIGRAAIGRPWLPGLIARALAGRPAVAPSVAQQRDLMLEHHDGLLSLYGREAGLRHARKHLAATMDAMAGEGGGDRHLRHAVLTGETPAAVARDFTAFAAGIDWRDAA